MILGEMRMLSRLNAPLHIPRTDQEQRRRIRQAEEALTGALGRSPTIQELAANFRTTAEEMVFLLEDASVYSYDQHHNGPSLVDMIPDESEWQTSFEIRDLLERLPTKDALLMRYRCLEGLTQSETAARLGLSQVQVSRREMVLRRQLRQAWQEADK